MEWTDAGIAEAARKGDQQAFRVLVERHSHALFRLAFRMTGNEQDAEDLVQETFLRVHRQLHRFDSRSSFSTWLYRICANLALDLLRARRLRNELQPSPASQDGLGWLDTVAAHEPSPERLMESRQLAGLLAPALSRLSALERAAFVLRHYEGFDVHHIAEALGVNGNAAKQSIFRAVQKLRRALRPVWEAGTR
jgi:RNA polymerase sigma-70 factor (ECF subfamily)